MLLCCSPRSSGSGWCRPLGTFSPAPGEQCSNTSSWERPNRTTRCFSIGPGYLPFNALQQLTYFGLIFFLVPFQILTGLAQSPSLLARFPWYGRLFGNRQAARSLHFLGLVMIGIYIVIHIIMVFWHNFAKEMDKMVLNHTHTEGSWLGVVLGLSIIATVVLIHVTASILSKTARRRVHLLLSGLVAPIRDSLLHNLNSAQEYPKEDISPYFRTNGYPPITAYPQAKGDDDTYEHLLSKQFADYRLEIKGMVEHPQKLSLEELRAMPKQEQTTMHNCIQGWTSVGRWGGVPLRDILRRCKPLPGAAFWCSLPLACTKKAARSITNASVWTSPSIRKRSWPMNSMGRNCRSKRRSVRVRFETKLGFKMVKFLRSIEVVEDYHPSATAWAASARTSSSTIWGRRFETQAIEVCSLFPVTLSGLVRWAILSHRLAS